MDVWEGRGGEGVEFVWVEEAGEGETRLL